MVIKMYCDGASRGNPGPGGFGTILELIDANGKLHTQKLSEGFENTTNNQMELLAVIRGFEKLSKPYDVEVYSDSKYVIDAFNQKWIDSWILSDFRRGKKNEVKNIQMWEKLIRLIKPHNVKWNWIKGHNGHPQNEECDRLATSAADKFL